MALSWIERIQHFFGKEPEYPTWRTVCNRINAEAAAKAAAEPVVPVEATPQLTEFEKIQAKFDPRTDMIVLSAEKAGSLSNDERNWLASLGKRVYYFADDSLVNIAIIKSW